MAVAVGPTAAATTLEDILASLSDLIVPAAALIAVCDDTTHHSNLAGVKVGCWLRGDFEVWWLVRVWHCLSVAEEDQKVMM